MFVHNNDFITTNYIDVCVIILQTDGFDKALQGKWCIDPNSREQQASSIPCIPYDSIVSVRDFLHNHVDECGILLPGRIPGYKSSDIKLLPSSESKSSVYRRYFLRIILKFSF